MNVLEQAERVLRDYKPTVQDGKEELYGRIWDHQEQEWTNAYVYYQEMGDSHLFRIRVDGNKIIEIRGSEFGAVLSTVLRRWEESQ